MQQLHLQLVVDAVAAPLAGVRQLRLAGIKMLHPVYIHSHERIQSLIGKSKIHVAYDSATAVVKLFFPAKALMDDYGCWKTVKFFGTKYDFGGRRAHALV